MNFHFRFFLSHVKLVNIVAAFRGMCMCRLRNIAMRDYTKKVWLPDRRTDRCRTKWSLCAAMLRRRHKNIRKIQIYRVFLPILLRKRCQCRGVTYDVINKLRCLSLSKSCPVLCHKLIYEIAMFHSINRETCDKIFYHTCPLCHVYIACNTFLARGLTKGVLCPCLDVFKTGSSWS